ncbi:uncharacterized protein LOC122456611 [Dermochelys coriacea]|uniref:uncharacterized protein LOC122456611 n=1 Tax=Dermochelys coriacea TaxID=27794 RepID=UPI001CAA3F13|nr:uncharacterized protein LOC122456611 [Dermochelys coriacea]XP_043353014.1 uncharacterized protein LOC122456611 [Dermochelys coriacea]
MFPRGPCGLVLALFWLALSTVHSAANSSQMCPTQQPGVSVWPVHSCSIPEGSSVQIPVSISRSMPEVCKRNPYTSQCDIILVLRSQKPQYFSSNFEGHITLSNKYFTVENMSKWLEGDYQIKHWNGTITASVSLTMADPTLFSPSTPGSPKVTERSANGTAERKNPANSNHYAYLALLVVPFMVVGWVLWKYVRRHSPDGRRFTSVNVDTDEHIHHNGHGHTNEHGCATVPLSQGAGAELHRLSGEENPPQAVTTPS